MSVVKREIDVDTICTGLDYGSIVSEAVADTSMDINAVPIIGDATGVATSAVSFVSHVTKAGMEIAKTALGCDDIPFDELKEVITEKYDEMGKKLDSLTEAMKKVSTMVSKTLEVVEMTRLEMQKGFEKVINTITETAVKDKCNQVSTFVEYFKGESERINKLSADDYVAKLEQPNGILNLLKESRTPRGVTLHTALNAIINNDYAIPKNENDKTAFQALFVLFYGVQTYVSIFGFLMKSHAYLANYYYKNDDHDKYNNKVDTIKVVFNDFKSSLTQRSTGFIDKLSTVLNNVKNKSFINKVNTNIYKEVSEKSKLVDFLRKEIQQMTLPIIEDIPKAPTLQLKPPHFNTPIGEWKNGVTVKYAVQYEKNGLYSKIGKWSQPLTISGKAYPTVKVSGSQDKLRLVFRKFNNETPQLVAILAKSNSEFRDRDRDLYNAAGAVDRDLALEEAAIFIENGANVNAIFEGGRTPLHNTGVSGNAKLFNFLKQKGASNVNVQDKKGYTPLHVAVKSERSMIISDMLQANVDVNKATTGDRLTALHLAVALNYRKVTEELLKSPKIDVNAKDVNGFTPLHVAMKGGNAIVEDLLKKRNLDINAKSNSGHAPAHLAAMNGNVRHLRSLKERSNFNPNIKDKNNLTPLHYAALLGNTEMVQKLMQHYSNLEVNVEGKNNKWTPLHYAIFFKKTESAIELVKNSRVNVNAKAISDVTPLHLAASKGESEIIKELLKRNANVNAKTSTGNTPLHLAAINNCKECVQSLLNKSADPNAKNNNGKTALDLAKEYKHQGLISILPSGKRFKKQAGFGNFLSNFGKGYSALDIGLNIATSREIPAQDSLMLESKLLESTGFSNLLLGGNGTLLLIDMLVRKFNNEKYPAFLTSEVPEVEAQVAALDMTERFENILDAINDIPANEQIDMSEVASNIKKALMSGQKSKVSKVLCYYAEMVKSLEPTDIEKLENILQSKNTSILNTGSKVYEDAALLVEASCNP